MKAVGIICEYNPFHMGHKYHIEKAKRLSGCDTVIAVMSGNFVQRGDAAVFDKAVRAKAALLNGVDLLIELPTHSSLSAAEHFAMSGVTVLNALPYVSHISFGAENDNIEKLTEIAQLLSEEPPEFKAQLSAFLSEGLPFALSRAKAVSTLIPEGDEILSSPNNILAIEYLKAIIKTKSTLTPLAVLRQGSGYNSPDTGSGFISATGARERIKKGVGLNGYVPENLLDLYENARIHQIENMEGAIIANLCKMDLSDIAKIPDVSEGLENRIKKEAMRCGDFKTLCDSIKSKRYAHSRIRRILLCSYLGIAKEDLILPKYLKILDFNEKGREFLNKIKQETHLPLVKNFNGIKALSSPALEEIWKKELIFDKIYDLF